MRPSFLIIKTSSIGDVILISPLLRRLRENHPLARIDVLCENSSRDIYRHSPHIDRLIVFPRQEMIECLKRFPRGLPDFFRYWRQSMRDLKMITYDTAVDLQGLLRTVGLLWACRARKKIAKGRWWFVDESVPDRFDDHAIECYFQVARSLNLGPTDYHTEYFFSPDDEKRADQFYREFGGRRKRFVFLNPFTRWSSKKWRLAGWRETADRLTKSGYTVILSGENKDRDEGTAILKGLSGVKNICGRFSLNTYAALLQRADLLITVDSGPMHLGNALGVPVVAIFGPTLPGRTGPIGATDIVIQSENCRKCYKRKCRHMTCMRDVTAEQVFDAALTILKRGRFQKTKSRTAGYRRRNES